MEWKESLVYMADKSSLSNLLKDYYLDIYVIIALKSDQDDIEP